MFDYLIVGAGFAGSVLAERLARDGGYKVLIVDRRPHIAGNAYDHYDDHGILVHKYGPHIFHTSSKDIFDYLSHFTPWRHYQHRVLASVDGQLLPIPINLDTINHLYGLKLTSFEVKEFLASVAEKRDVVKTSEDVVVGTVGRELYEKFFRGYTRKQWGLDPSELDAQVTARVPTRTNRDDRYFTDAYQSMPLHGYTRMFEKMLDHKNIKVMLNTDYREVEQYVTYKNMIYTGPVDGYFDYRFGKLPYRCLEFKHETHAQKTFQKAPVINYPNDYAYTRITEFKYLTGQDHEKTSVVYEFPQAEGDPYYPIPKAENAAIYQKYQALAESTPNVHFVGRLATYRYYNMDQVVAQALTLYGKLSGKPTLQQASAFNQSTSPSRVNGQPYLNGHADGSFIAREGGAVVSHNKNSLLNGLKNGNGHAASELKQNGNPISNGNGSGPATEVAPRKPSRRTANEPNGTGERKARIKSKPSKLIGA